MIDPKVMADMMVAEFEAGKAAERARLLPVLRQLLDASEDYVTSDPDMPSHEQSGTRYEYAVAAARAAVRSCRGPVASITR